ncbi:uncharacterized protein SCHCODRAFT_02498824 [Schizophyllum commune H4-8]|nr:uncharacterized protein SCHCODRAFT_02498824 [Schizophyllum commune H4-8]KAI5893928.1 hypothetical protein SCHCODRAFT_02498824 [Schizophyllum commune H4-8]
MSKETTARSPGESQDATRPLFSAQVSHQEDDGEDAPDEVDDGPPPLVDPPPSMTFTFNTDMTPYEGGLQQTAPFPTAFPSFTTASSGPPSGGELVSLYPNDAFIGGGRTNRRRAQDPDYIPRAPNAFILFRASFVRTHQLEAGSGGKKDRLGKLVGQAWRALPAHERKEWEVRAALAQEEHRRRYPDWRFKPQQIAAGLGQPSGPRPRKGRIKDGGGGNHDRGEGSSKDTAAASRSRTEESAAQEESQNASSSANVYEFPGPQILLDAPTGNIPSEEQPSALPSTSPSLNQQDARQTFPVPTTRQYLVPPPPSDAASGRVRSRSLATSTRSRSTPSRRGRGRSVDLSGVSRPVPQPPESPRKRSAKVAQLSTSDEHDPLRGRNAGVSPPRKRQDKGKGREASVSGGLFATVASSSEQQEQAQWDGPPSTPESSFSSPVLSEAAASTASTQPLQAPTQGPLNIRFFHDPRSASSPKKAPRDSSNDPYASSVPLHPIPFPTTAPRTPTMSPATTVLSPLTSPATSYASPVMQTAAVQESERNPFSTVPLTEMFKRASSAPPVEKGSSSSSSSSSSTSTRVPDFIARREEEEESDGDGGSSSGSTTPQNVVRAAPPGSAPISIPFGVGKVGQPGVGWDGTGPLFPFAASGGSLGGIGARPTHGRRETISLPVQRAPPIHQTPPVHQHEYSFASGVSSGHSSPHFAAVHAPIPASYAEGYQHHQQIQPTAQVENQPAARDASAQQNPQQNWAPLTTEGMGYDCSDWQARPLLLCRPRPQLIIAQPYHHQQPEDTGGISWTRAEGRQGVVAAIDAPKAQEKWPSEYEGETLQYPETMDWTTQDSPEPPPVMLPAPNEPAYGQHQQQPIEYPTYQSTGWAETGWTAHASREPAQAGYNPGVWPPQQTTWAQNTTWDQQQYYQQYTQSPYTHSQPSLLSQPQQSWTQPQHSPYMHAQHSPYAHPMHSPYAQTEHPSAQVSPLASPAMKSLPPTEQPRSNWGGGWAAESEDLSSNTAGMYPSGSGWSSYQGGWDAPSEERR